MRHIHIIAPVANEGLACGLANTLAEAARPDTCVSSTHLAAGPDSIESIFEEAVATPGVVQRAMEAERAGANAVIIDCMDDPGLEAAREAVAIPVIGAAQAAMLTAGLLAHRFSVIGTDRRDVYPIERLVAHYGLREKYASTRWVNIPVLELGVDRERLLTDLLEQSTRAVCEDGAHAIVFGCTAMRSLRGEVQARLAERGIRAPIIDPSSTAMKWGEALADLGLSHSRRSYPPAGGKLVTAAGEPSPVLSSPVPGRRAQNQTLAVLVPVVRGRRGADWLQPTLQGYRRFASHGTRVEVLPIERGPAEITSPYDQAMATIDLLRLARQAERDGAGAVLIDCMCDPGLDPLREALQIPVVGPLQASAFLASMLACRFSIIGTSTEYLHEYRAKLDGYGLGSRLASVRGVGMSPIEVESDPQRTTKKMIEAARQAVVADGAHAIIPGCTGMIGLAEQTRSALLAGGIDVPVIEPPAAAVRVAELLCELGLAQSKQTWPTPPRKPLIGYPELEFA